MNIYVRSDTEANTYMLREVGNSKTTISSDTSLESLKVSGQ